MLIKLWQISKRYFPIQVHLFTTADISGDGEDETKVYSRGL